MERSVKICILIPAYNAQATLGGVLEKIKPMKMDTVVVNDGSTDGTKELARRCGAHVLEHPSNLGKGMALRTGFGFVLQEGYGLVITLDADGQHNPSDIPHLLSVFQIIQPDLLIASRAERFDQMPILRRFWNRLGVKAVARRCHADITDSQSGYRIIRAEVLRGITLTTSHFETELEVLIKACQKGYRVLSIPLYVSRIDGTSTSHFRPVSDTWKICKLYLRSLLW